MLDENGETFVFLGVEVGVFEEIQIAGAADSFDFAEYAEGVETQFFEFFAGGDWKHGRDYINFRAGYNGTLVLRVCGGEEWLAETRYVMLVAGTADSSRAAKRRFGMTRLPCWVPSIRGKRDCIMRRNG